MYAVLCNANGVRSLGSDGIINVDGRLSNFNKVQQAKIYRRRFLANFRWKYDLWTHCYFVKSFRDIDTNQRLHLIAKETS